MKQRKPNRLQGYDYSQDNLYFVTSCVQDRICCLGEIKNKQMQLNQYGQIAQQQWHWLGQQYAYIVLHAFVVMPNHIHGIIEINRGVVRTDDTVRTDTVQTGRDLSLQLQQQKIKSLSQLMGAYKTTTSKQIHLLDYNAFAWQRSFHDHIIRDEQSYEKISAYIHNNPAQWQEDKFYLI